MTQPPERTPDPHATPDEGTRRGVCTRAACEGNIASRLRNSIEVIEVSVLR